MGSALDHIPPALLVREPKDDRPIVVMTCGLAGSGKTTLAKAILNQYPTFNRISIDEIIYSKHGMYGIDYPASDSLHAQYELEADDIYLATFQALLKKKKDVILERSFYAKDDRDDFRGLAERGGARVVFVFLKARNKEKLWDRICKRSAGEKDANSALDINRETFEMYWKGFEDPADEGEIVVEVL